MAEKLCLRWNDFQDNVKNAFGHLRDTTDFVDLTLACEDGRKIEAHKVILAASSPYFQRIVRENKHSHLLIYMKEVKCDDLTAIIDFVYYGEVNIYQENLNSFLAIGEELQLKGLEGSKDQSGSAKEEQMKPEENHTTSHGATISRTPLIKNETTDDSNKTRGNALALPIRLKTSIMSTNLQELEETVQAMMETSENLIQEGKWQKRAKICKACGKEGPSTNIKQHIEANHLEGLSLPCNLCDKIFRSKRFWVIMLKGKKK